MTDLLDLLRVLLGKKFPFKIIYSSDYWMLDTGKHVFPVRKYRLLYEKLIASGARKDNFLAPAPASDEDILRVHSQKYLRKLKSGALSSTETAALELPFSPDLVKCALLTVGGTILTAERALEEGLAVHLGGGFHHAFPDHGEGFCVLNDVAVAVEKMRAEGRVKKVMIVDCDVHQGNGTAAIFQGEESVFTFSIHQMDIYPSEKPPGTLDVGLWSGDGDSKYLAELKSHFPRLYEEFRPDLVFYLAGADPYKKDRLGGLTLTEEGLKERDRLLIEGARRLRIPVAIVLGGGYPVAIDDIVALHFNTILAAREAQKKFLTPAPFRRARPGSPRTA